MNLVIGSDHGGFEAKEKIKKFLLAQGHSVTDFGCYSLEAVDYPDIALLVGEAVIRREYERGILLDGTGGGMTLAANKVPGVRAVCAYSELTGKYASEHDDANVLCLGGKTVGELILQETVRAWVETPFGGGRHTRRLGKIAEIEKKYSRMPF
ncbi:MAG TPA: RpiB/LacA/LacB family sugar-phosphate isomerase [Elusimicrobiota bacterium]|nr:RpiB/LacA/LacB family sugar-phosphate isomerase [Elusimicrobiota bacterium]